MFNINDSFSINRISLSGEDYQSLSECYLPLIGTNAYSLYIVLCNLDCNEVLVKYILDLMNFNKSQSFNQALSFLEGIGLCKEYVSKNDKIIHLNHPLSKKQFLNNVILKKYLQSKMGPIELTSENNYVGYQDKTLRFDEVFKTGDKNTIISNIDVTTDDIKIKNTNFDYLVFKVLVEKKLSKELINDEDFKNNILKISYQYNLNEMEMQEAIERNLVYDNDLSYETISKYAGFIYQNKTPNKFLGFEVKTPVEYKKDLTSEDEKLQKLVESNSITQILETISGGKAIRSDIEDYTRLKESTGLSEGVINLLILRLNEVKNGDSLSYSYIEKVCRNWIKAGVKDTKSAINYLNTLKEKKQNNKSNKGINPQFKDVNDLDLKDLSEEEMKEAQELAKELLGK